MKRLIICSLVFLVSSNSFAQYKSYTIGTKRDTINIVDKKDLKQGRWVIKMPELRGEPGYDEEGVYKNGEKNGYWRKYSAQGDLLSVENYRLGGKDGLQQYFNMVGDIVREETWRGYNPDAPYDTIPVYGAGNNEIVEYKIVKALPYAVKNGPWRYYEQGMVYKTEEWDRNNLVIPLPPAEALAAAAKKDKPKKVEKTAEMLAWEKKNKGKKKVLRDGSTGL